MRRVLAIATMASLLASCVFPPAATVPMATIAPAPVAGNDTLMIFLPGLGDRAQDFVDHGFLHAREGVDLIASDAHVGYYAARTIVERLHDDVIAPAREAGYNRIILVGISMGGLGALLYNEQHPGAIDGLVLIAPFLGDQGVAGEIRDSGGLLAWSGETTAGDPYEREVWLSLQRSIVNTQPILLLYGRDDRYKETLQLLADALPPTAVVIGDGGHDWRTWETLWGRAAERVELQ